MDAMEIIKMAVKDVAKVDELRGMVGGDVEGFRSRARSAPGLVLDSGLLPAYTFILSKSDLSLTTLNKLKDYFMCNSKLQLDGNEKRELEKEIGSGEGAGYGLMSTLLTIRIKNILKEFGVETNEKDFMKLAIEIIEILTKDSKIRISTEKYLLMYLEELKKLVDAYYKAKWKGGNK